MIRVVLDTNVLASGAIATSGAVAEILDAWNHYDVQVVLSDWILRELARTLSKPYFSTQLSDEDIIDFLSFCQDRAHFVQVGSLEIPRVATHREDDYVLATAVAGRVDYLITGDRMVRALNSYQSIEILTAREFLDRPNDASDL